MAGLGKCVCGGGWEFDFKLRGGVFGRERFLGVVCLFVCLLFLLVVVVSDVM